MPNSVAAPLLCTNRHRLPMLKGNIPMKKTVRITVEGGVVQHVQVPKGVTVVVRDYDVDGEDEGLEEDENGDKYVESVWNDTD